MKFNSDPSIVSMELNIAAEKMMYQYATHSEEMQQKVEAGIKYAIDNFDFEREVAEQGTAIIRQTIQAALNQSSLREIIESKIEKIMTELIEKEIKHLKTKKK